MVFHYSSKVCKVLEILQYNFNMVGTLCIYLLLVDKRAESFFCTFPTLYQMMFNNHIFGLSFSRNYSLIWTLIWNELDELNFLFVFLQPTSSYPNNVMSTFLCFIFARLLCSVPLEFCQLSLVRLTICFSLPFYKCFEFLFESIKCVVQRMGVTDEI